MTFLSPIIMIGLFTLVTYLSQLNNDKVRTIAIYDQSGLLKNAFENTEHTTYSILENMSFKSAKKLVKEAKDKRVVCTLNGNFSFHCAMLPKGTFHYILLNREISKKLNEIKNKKNS